MLEEIKERKRKGCVTGDREGRSEGIERHLINLERQEGPAPLCLLGHEKKFRFYFRYKEEPLKHLSKRVT